MIQIYWLYFQLILLPAQHLPEFYPRESAAVLPCPGKCLAVAITSLECRPSIATITRSATFSGSSPKERVPIMGFLGFELTSDTGERLQKIPTEESS